MVKLKKYAEAEWIAAENTVGCKGLIRQYEAVHALKKLGTGLIASSKMNVVELCAAVGLNVKKRNQWTQQKSRYSCNIERRNGNDESKVEDVG